MFSKNVALINLLITAALFSGHSLEAKTSTQKKKSSRAPASTSYEFNIKYIYKDVPDAAALNFPEIATTKRTYASARSTALAYVSRASVNVSLDLDPSHAACACPSEQQSCQIANKTVEGVKFVSISVTNVLVDSNDDNRPRDPWPSPSGEERPRFYNETRCTVVVQVKPAIAFITGMTAPEPASNEPRNPWPSDDGMSHRSRGSEYLFDCYLASASTPAELLNDYVRRDDSACESQPPVLLD